ncbi:TPA: hypothetical protein ACSVPQ_001590 [Clostridioides difficile]|uniref:hypothetical protein n=1 Tax=Clostridioides difficile TaxID=1496 RepID=UPI0003B2A44E|nr:hypothetical protein [Clostridioides difficile]EGT5399583.1 hypothetical protein [Clostridioides difficile]EII6781669.1 hypothetical protein [Clostridioides difficile]EKS6795679.1 hypothetical protein [Clostridioides difficile]ELX4546619.1 hypothetical protein [Clostridioides difficile]MBF9986716.1 hypothetical protein [Clostridioides difficile]
MSYLEMKLRNEENKTSTNGICLNFGKFLADLDFSTDTEYYKWDEYPIERYHEKMSEVLEKIDHKKQKLPLLISISLDEEMAFLSSTLSYQFIIMDKPMFMRMEHEYELDKEALKICKNEDMDCIVIYMGMSVCE